MTAFRLPLSGDVTQTFNINVGESSNTAVEKDALSLASYRKQLGRIGDALVVLLNRLQDRLQHLEPDEEKAIVDLKCLLHEMANAKNKHGAKHILWPKLT